jgi:hypothetical protein
MARPTPAASTHAPSLIALVLLAAGPAFAQPAAGAPAAPSGVSVVLGAGSSVLLAPERLRGESPPGFAVGASVDLPWRRAWSLSIQAEHIEREDGDAPDVGFAADPFADSSSAIAIVNRSLSFRATMATVGLRWRGDRARWIPTLRAGLGWGRTSGFGYVTRFDGSGNTTRVPLTSPVAGMTPADGFAYSASAGLETPLKRTLRLFGEVGVLGLRAREWIVVFPVRAGVALR